jgi:hypothetical protein
VIQGSMRLALIALLCAGGALAETRSLAVLECRNKLLPQDRAAVDAGYLAGQVRTAAIESAPSLRVITKENLIVLLQATGRDLDSCEGECEVDTGRRIGADLVVSGELLKFGSSYKLDMRLHDTKEGRMLSGATASGATPDALDKNLPEAIARLLAPVVAGARAGTSLPAVPQGRAPLLVMVHGILGAPREATFKFSVDSALGRESCDEPVSQDNPCRLAVPAGAITAVVGGHEQMSNTLTIPPKGGTATINYTGRSLLWWGLGTTAAGAVGIGIGIGSSSLGGQLAGYTAGGMAAAVGLSLLLAHAVASAAGTRITFDEAGR